MAIRILLSRKLGELRWNQAQLARKTGIRPNTINELYHELVERVSLEQLDLICKALDCKLSDILIRDAKAGLSLIRPIASRLRVRKYLQSVLWISSVKKTVSLPLR